MANLPKVAFSAGGGEKSVYVYIKRVYTHAHIHDTLTNLKYDINRFATDSAVSFK